MKNLTKKFSKLIALSFFFTVVINAQVDVTSDYLINADFETDPIMESVDSLEPANNKMHPITGWNVSPSMAFAKLFSLPYGVPSSAVSNTLSVDVPNNETSVQGDNNYLIAIKHHWGDQGHMEQVITLPAGKYALSWDSFVRQDINSGGSLCGYIIDEVETYGPLASALNVWEVQNLEFTLEEEKSVTIRFGYKKVGNTGGGGSPVLFIDNIKLTNLSIIDKTELLTKIDEVKAIVVEDSPGESVINSIITTAEDVSIDDNASVEDILNTIGNLDKAKVGYLNNSLSDIQVDNMGVSNFSPTVLNYTFYNAFGADNIVAGTLDNTDFNASVTVNVVDNIATLTVTAGNGATKEYNVELVDNYIANWVGDATPGDAGWLTVEGVDWSGLNTPGGRNCYRDGLATGGDMRALVGNPNTHFAFPLTNLKEGKIYRMSANYKWISNGNAGEDRRWTFGVNTAIDGAEETMLGIASGLGGGVATATFEFVYSGESEIYFTWNGNRAAYAIDNLILVESGDAIKVEFDTDTDDDIDPIYVISGNTIPEPAAILREDYEFEGWVTTYNEEWDFNSPVVENMTLFAKWKSVSTSINSNNFDSDIELYTQDNMLVIKANSMSQVYIYTISGTLINRIDMESGVVERVVLPSGVYIINGSKILIK